MEDGDLILFTKSEGANIKLRFSANIDGRAAFADVVKDSELSRKLELLRVSICLNTAI